MGNCLSSCAKRPEPASQGQEAECVQITENIQITSQVNTDNQQSTLKGENVRDLVQQELEALQTQISHSQAVLSKLHFRFNDESVLESNPDLPKVHRTTQTSNSDSGPKSLECVSGNVEKDWQHLTLSCPAIVNTAVQTDEETSKSNGSSGEYFLPPISPLDSCSREPVSPQDLQVELTKRFDPRPSGPDLDIYRSCRKLSVLPEEETVAQEEETSPLSVGNRLAPTHYPHHQAHSFESYLLPVEPSPVVPAVQRQLSDPTPSPRIHPTSRRTSRSTCRPLQLQPDSNYFCFPEVSDESTKREESALKSPPCVKFEDSLEFKEGDDYIPRITSPTYNILQDTVSQLITMSSETLDVQTDKLSSKKESLSIPGYYAFTPDGSSPFKTPPENSMISTPGFFTPQEVCKFPDSSASSAFHTPSSISPGTNHTGSNKSTSTSSHSFKTPPPNDLSSSQETPYQSSFGSPLYCSPPSNKRSLPTNEINEINFTDIADVNSICMNSKLYVKPLKNDFDRNRTMLSILLDQPRVQNDNINVQNQNYSTPIISFTSLEMNKTHEPVHMQEQVPSAPSSLSSPDAALSPTSENLSRTPSRRRLQRSLVRISSETPLELVPVEKSVILPSADGHSATSTSQLQARDVQKKSENGSSENLPSKAEGSPGVRRTNSDGGSGGMASLASLPPSNSFPSLSDTVLKQLGALMEDVKQQKEENQSSDQNVESKFTSLMLAFKTDKLTLERRLELQMRLRDQAEQNMAAELSKLKAAVQMLSPLCTDSEKIELLEKVSEQVDALYKSTTRVSTSAEMYGAVQQEDRLSRAVDIILRHVENLKQAYNKEKTEHEETRKILTDNKISPTAVLKLQSSKRRASIATLTRAQTPPDPSRSPILAGEGRGVSQARLGSLPRKLSNTILEAEQEENTTANDSANNGTGSSQPHESAEPVNSTAPTQPRTLQRKPSRPTVVEERRASHTGDTESEDESSTVEPLCQVEPPLPPENNTTLTSTRRISLQAVWINKLSEHLEWVQPMDQLLKHLRYFVAAMLLIAALAVFTSTFILPHTRLSR